MNETGYGEKATKPYIYIRYQQICTHPTEVNISTEPTISNDDTLVTEDFLWGFVGLADDFDSYNLVMTTLLVSVTTKL